MGTVTFFYRDWPKIWFPFCTMFWLYCVNPPTSLAVLPFHAQVLLGLLLAYEPFVASVFSSSLSSWHCGLSSPGTPQGSHKLRSLYLCLLSSLPKYPLCGVSSPGPHSHLVNAHTGSPTQILNCILLSPMKIRWWVPKRLQTLIYFGVWVFFCFFFVWFS